MLAGNITWYETEALGCIGFDLHPDHLFTFGVAVNTLHYNHRLDIISKEGDRAGKEFHDRVVTGQDARDLERCQIPDSPLITNIPERILSKVISQTMTFSAIQRTI
jgi:hypothetical protein